MTILLIEDDAGLAELLTEFLGMSGYEVLHFADGELRTTHHTRSVFAAPWWQKDGMQVKDRPGGTGGTLNHCFVMQQP